MIEVYRTELGKALHGDSLEYLKTLDRESVDLVVTSPPFALQKKKSYGNVPANEYLSWFLPFALEIYRVLKRRGSFVLDLGGTWNKGEPTRSLYHFEVLINLCRPNGPFRLAQEFYWYNPAKLPTPAQWVTIKRNRVKDAVNTIWWLSKSSNPKASNRRVLTPYSKSMKKLLINGYNAGPRPSGHVISDKWGKKNKGAIPPNIIIASNTKSNDEYISACKKYDLEIHPARFVESIPEFFVKFLTLRNDIVLDPFAGSNVVGYIAEKLEREWISVEIVEDYVIGSAFRFTDIGKKLIKKYY